MDARGSERAGPEGAVRMTATGGRPCRAFRSKYILHTVKRIGLPPPAGIILFLICLLMRFLSATNNLGGVEASERRPIDSCLRVKYTPHDEFSIKIRRLI